MDKHAILRQYFGHDEFRPGQETMVDAILAGRDVLGVMPTGAGKSMCYQVPALMLPGITLVISPLISLMADQVAALKAAGVPAAYFNSTLTPRQMDIAVQRARMGAYKIIYVAPERLETTSFIEFARSVEISLLAVDEAHCVSQWGQDFRPVYLRIAEFAALLSKRPVVGAFTATATARVRDDIVRHLRLLNPTTITTGFDRPNLYFEVVRTKEGRDNTLLAITRSMGSDPGIIYCATRKAVETVCDKLIRAGISAGRYHAGLPDDERRQAQEDFQYDRIQVMVATNAFGMGIDKSNVRFVIHYNMPRSMEAYYQEAGRAGRDGAPATCIMIYNASDIFTARWMINHSEPNEALSAAEQANVRRLDYDRLQQMIDYCTRDACLRTFILRYFGERVQEDCGACSCCTGGRYQHYATTETTSRGRTAKVTQATKTQATARGKSPAASLPNIAPPKVAPPEGKVLFEQLRAVRLALAKAQHVPPYIICTDTTLTDMVRKKPQTSEGMLSVSGMGEAKVARYGEAFLNVIRTYVANERTNRSRGQTVAREVQSTAYRKGAVKKPPEIVPERAPVHAGMGEEDIREAYLSGVPIQEIADTMGVTAAALRRKMREMGLIF